MHKKHNRTSKYSSVKWRSYFNMVNKVNMDNVKSEHADNRRTKTIEINYSQHLL